MSNDDDTKRLLDLLIFLGANGSMVPADHKPTDSIHIISNDHLYIASVYERLIFCG